VLHPGDTVELITPGAGGYGKPAERDPDMIEQDLADCRMIGPS
jgi:N-methylhydantoinase B